MIEEEEREGGQAMGVVQWGPDPDARNSKSSQLPSRAHSRSPVSCSNLTDNQAARRAEGAWRCLAETPLAPPPPSFAPPSGLTPTALKSAALSGSPHNNQHRSVGQYKGLNSQSKRRLKSSISLDSLRSSHPYPQNSHYSLPLRLSSSKTTTTTPTVTTNTSSSASAPVTRDQLVSPNPSTRSSGIDKKVFQSRLRRRPSAQLLSSSSILDRLKSEDTMMVQSSQHNLPHERMTAMEDISLHGQILDKYRVDGSYGAPLPLSPPPSATRPEFIGTNSTSSSFQMNENVGLSFSASEIGMARPHSMSTLRDVSSFSEQAQDGGDIPRLSNQYQDMNQVGESSMFMRQSPQACWSSSNWLADIPQPLDMDMMESSSDQSPTAQQWVDENGNSETSHLRLSTETGLPMVMPGINQPHTSFRLASPPIGRGIHRLPSCPSFRGPNLDYHIQQPPSPALEEHDDITNFPQYMERSCSNSSSIPSPPDSPDFYFPPSQIHTPGLGFSVTPLVNQDGFSSDMYVQMSDPQRNGIHSNSISTARSSRTSSRSIPSQAAAAAAAALSATKSSSKTSKGRSSRRVVSNSNGRNSSSRNGSASSSSGSASGRGLGLGSDGGEMPFVNFTPQDATRILSGVAPSGSSKTKARREREAMEKRRKLSEAAAAAVLAAGGDPSQLKEVELLTMT